MHAGEREIIKNVTPKLLQQDLATKLIIIVHAEALIDVLTILLVE